MIVHGRNAERGRALVGAIQRAGGTADFHAADFGSLAEVRRLADTLESRYSQLDVLVNNAGVVTLGNVRTETSDGYERHFAINYLAPLLLTRALLPLLGARAPSRVINVVSAGQAAIDFDDIMLEHDYDGFLAYMRSKLAGVMMTFDLAAALAKRNVTVNSLHPGTNMDTTMVRENGVQPTTPVEKGADALMALVDGPEHAATTGCYFDGLREARAHSQAYNAEARRRLHVFGKRLTSGWDH